MTLHILHEGIHDKKYFETFIKDDLLKKYECKSLKARQYKTNEFVSKYIKTQIELGNICLIFGDADFQNTEAKKPKNYSELQALLCKKYDIKIDKSKIVFIIVEEIESWYLAGFDNAFCKKNNVKYYKNTENVTAEMFADCRIRPEQSEDQFRNWLIKNKTEYKIDEAKQRNSSFKVFYDAKE